MSTVAVSTELLADKDDVPQAPLEDDMSNLLKAWETISVFVNFKLYMIMWQRDSNQGDNNVIEEDGRLLREIVVYWWRWEAIKRDGQVLVEMGGY